MKSKNRVIQEYYGLHRRVTDEEVQAEIKMLERKDREGQLDDLTRPLFIALKLDRLRHAR